MIWLLVLLGCGLTASAPEGEPEAKAPYPPFDELTVESCKQGVSPECARFADGLVDKETPEGVRAGVDVYSATCSKWPREDEGRRACSEGGYLLLDAGNPGGAGLLAQACGTGDPLACGRLAREHVEGTVLERNYAGAFEFLIEACNLDHAPACEMAAKLATQAGSQEYAARAPELLKRACDLGQESACAPRSDR